MKMSVQRALPDWAYKSHIYQELWLMFEKLVLDASKKGLSITNIKKYDEITSYSGELNFRHLKLEADCVPMTGWHPDASYKG